MNRERFAGLCLQLFGTVNQFWGELSGDSSRIGAGERDRILGKARQTSGSEREESVRQLEDFQHHHRNWHF